MVEEFLFDKIADNEDKETPTTTLVLRNSKGISGILFGFASRTSNMVIFLRKMSYTKRKNPNFVTDFSSSGEFSPIVVGVSNDVGIDYSGQVTDFHRNCEKNAINLLHKFNSTGDGFSQKNAKNLLRKFNSTGDGFSQRDFWFLAVSRPINLFFGERGVDCCYFFGKSNGNGFFGEKQSVSSSFFYGFGVGLMSGECNDW